MSVISHFLKKASNTGLQTYFSTLDSFEPIDWSKDHSDVIREVIAVFEGLPAATQNQMRLDLERVKLMSNDVGLASLMGTFIDSSELLEQTCAADRSVWVFVNHPERFRQAEDIRYADHYRHGSKWSGYQVDAELPLHNDVKSVDAFKTKIKSALGLGNKVKVEVFDRMQPDDMGKDNDVIQVMIFQEGLPDSYLEFKNDDDIVSRIRRPVSEHAITYAPDTGTIEVIASGKARREIIAKAFTDNLLKQPTDADRIPLRQFNLMPLMENQPLDWDEEDGIRSVQLVQIKVEDVDGDGRVQIEVPAKSDIALHDYVKKHIAGQKPLSTKDFKPTQAKIHICFYPEMGRGRGKVLPVKITLPNGCDLRSRTEKERLIGEKYLKRWGLLKEIVA